MDRGTTPSRGAGDLLQPPRQGTEVAGVGRRRVGRLNLGVHLRPVHLDAAGCLDAEPHRVTPDVQDNHADLVPDHDALTGSAGQDWFLFTDGQEKAFFL